MIRGRARWRIRASGTEGFDLNLPAEERELLRELPGHLSVALDGVEASGEVPEELRRLFPVAEPRDPDAEARHAAERRPQLLSHHREALDCLAETADARHLTSEQMQEWLGALNSLRLVLGTSLGVTEEMEEPDPAGPRFADWICYQYLSYLSDEVIDLLSDALPPPLDGADEDVPDDPWGEPLGGLRWDGTPLPEVP